MKKAFAVQSIELAVSAPHVISQRLFQLTSVGFSPSAADYHEHYRMWTEKYFGFGESWLATTLETARFQQQILTSTAGYWMMPWLLPQAAVYASVAYSPVATERMLHKAMEPIHGMVVKNAKRLSHK